MLLSLGLLLLVGLSMAGICQKLKLPRIIGMLLCGVVLGPYVLDLLDSTILNISTELRQIALIIILIKAGLSLNISDLSQVGRSAVLMSFVPASFEILAYLIFAPLLLGINLKEALLMGSVLAAVSPAVVVPYMIKLIDNGIGTKKSIPQLILAGASCDDVFVIVLFTSFSAMVSGNQVHSNPIIEIILSIIFGILIGIVLGVLLSHIFEQFYNKGKFIRNSTKVIIFLALSLLLLSLENLTQIPYSALLSVVSMACVYKIKTSPSLILDLSSKFGSIWIGAEILLFVLVGASVNIHYLFSNFGLALIMIFIGLCIRCIGVLISLIGTKLNRKERIFCMFAYLPKATVQAAIGSIPLSLGLECGSIILTVAVCSILITAPLGALLIDKTHNILLKE